MWLSSTSTLCVLQASMLSCTVSEHSIRIEPYRSCLFARDSAVRNKFFSFPRLPVSNIAYFRNRLLASCETDPASKKKPKGYKKKKQTKKDGPRSATLEVEYSDQLNRLRNLRGVVLVCLICRLAAKKYVASTYL